jgi:hypothetical protein
LALLPGSAPPAGSPVLVGSEPQAARLRVAIAASAASLAARELKRRFVGRAARVCVVMRVLHKSGVIPLR